jgi:hypothetical protein
LVLKSLAFLRVLCHFRLVLQLAFYSHFVIEKDKQADGMEIWGNEDFPTGYLIFSRTV